MSIDRAIPGVAREALASADPKGRRDYAAHLYQKGYTCTSIADACGVTRQGVHRWSQVRPDQRLPEGFPLVPRVRRTKRNRDLPPIPAPLREQMLADWMLSSRRRHQHGPDSPWAKAAQRFLDEVLVLQSHGYLITDIATDLGLPTDTVYHRVHRGRLSA